MTYNLILWHENGREHLLDALHQAACFDVPGGNIMLHETKNDKALSMSSLDKDDKDEKAETTEDPEDDWKEEDLEDDAAEEEDEEDQAVRRAWGMD